MIVAAAVINDVVLIAELFRHHKGILHSFSFFLIGYYYLLSADRVRDFCMQLSK